MSNTVLPHFARPVQSFADRGFGLVTAVVLGGWLAMVVALAVGGIFVTPAGTPPWPILVAAALPVIAFLAAFRLSRGFRDRILNADLRLMMAIQAWRFAGIGFLALFSYDILPASFALPAGLGDMAIAATAPWMLSALLRNPGFAKSRAFVSWNVFGIVDLVLAIGLGALAAAGVAGEGLDMTAMARLPLAVVPAYLVPVFVMMHIAALGQARRSA